MVRFEARFFERYVHTQLAKQADVSVWVNVAWGITGPVAGRTEIDALTRTSRGLEAVEVKSHTLDEPTAEHIVDTYAPLGFAGVRVIAPDATPEAAAYLKRHPGFALEVLHPDLEPITVYYAETFADRVPAWVADSLATGQHHIRFILSTPDARGRWVYGQPRSRMYTPQAIAAAISRLPSPPARVLWTPTRFTIPRDAIARGSNLTPIGGYIAVDVDGDKLHAAHHACTLPPGQATCPHCLERARGEAERLLTAAPELTWTPALHSGGRGVHAYTRAETGVRQHLTAIIKTHRIGCDASVTTSSKATVALPGSLHAGTGLAVAPVPGEEMVAAC